MKNTIHYLSIHEFSELVGVPKERLRFYDNEGLFPPAKRAANGYRYYTHDQLYHFFLVTMLARFDYYSLNEIRDMFNQKDCTIQEIYETQQPLLLEKYERLQKTITDTEYSIYYQNYTDTFEMNIPHLTEFKYPQRIITYLEHESDLFSKVALEALDKHTKITHNIPDAIAVPFSFILSKEAFYNPKFHITAFYSITNQQITTDAVYKPAETRLTLFYHYYGNIREIHSKMVFLNDYMNEHQLVMADDLYITLSTTNATQIQDHLSYIRIVIPVEKKEKDFVPTQKQLMPTKTRPDLLFTSGKFAKLCNLPKETIRFYNQIGILTPYEVKNNHYKYYNVEQISYIYALKMLQKSGCTINEIKNYMIDNKTSSVELFKLGITHHKRVARRLLHYLKMTNAILVIREHLSDFANTHKPFELDFYVIPHEYSEMAIPVDIHSKEAMENLKIHIAKIYAPEKLIYFPLAINMAPDMFENGSFLIKSHSSFSFTRYDDIHTLPKQKYLFFSAEIHYSEVTNKLEYLQAYVHKQNYTITGDIQIIITVHDLYKTTKNLYLFYFFIPIK